MGRYTLQDSTDASHILIDKQETEKVWGITRDGSRREASSIITNWSKDGPEFCPTPQLPLPPPPLHTRFFIARNCGVYLHFACESPYPSITGNNYETAFHSELREISITSFCGNFLSLIIRGTKLGNFLK